MSNSLTSLYLSNPALATAIRRQQAGLDMAQEASSVAPASPWQALARLANAYVGTKMASGAEGDIQAEGEKMRQEARDFMGGDLPMGGGVPQGGQPQSLPAPAISGSAEVPPDLMPHYQAASQATGIPVHVLVAKDKQESGFNNSLRGGAGEIGISQVLPSTAAAPGYGLPPIAPDALQDPATNIRFGAQYLGARGKVAGVTDWNDPNQVATALKAYNGGGDPNYVQNVMRFMPGGAPAPTGGGMPQGGAPRADPQSGQYMALAQEYLRRSQAAGMSPNPLIQRQAAGYKAQAEMYAKLGMEKPQTHSLSPGGALVDASGRVLVRNEDRTQQPVVVQNGVDEKGNPRWVYASRDSAIGQSAPTPGPMVTVDQRGPNAEATERGQTLAKQAAALRDQADVAASTIDQVRQLRNIGAETSRLAPAKELIGSVLDALGVKDTTRVRDAQTLQAFNGALSAIVLGEQLRQKGVQTEGDASRMREQFAKATNTMEANDLLMRMVEGAALRQMERADFYEKWYQQNKTYDGAQGAWTRFIRDVPMTLRGQGGVKFYHEGRDAAAAEGISPEDFDAQWKAVAARK